MVIYILQGLKVTMKKHPSMLRLVGPLADRNNTVTDTAVTLYEGKKKLERGREGEMREETCLR